MNPVRRLLGLPAGTAWSWSGGRGEFLGTWPAKRRRCRACKPKDKAKA